MRRFVLLFINCGNFMVSCKKDYRLQVDLPRKFYPCTIYPLLSFYERQTDGDDVGRGGGRENLLFFTEESVFCFHFFFSLKNIKKKRCQSFKS